MGFSRTATWELPPRGTAAQESREHVLDMCCGLSVDNSEIAALLVDEVVVNAFQHGEGRVVLSVATDGERVRVEVQDENPRPPQVVDLGPLAERGRGMRLVDALATQWGTIAVHPGKRVWFELG